MSYHVDNKTKAHSLLQEYHKDKMLRLASNPLDSIIMTEQSQVMEL